MDQLEKYRDSFSIANQILGVGIVSKNILQGFTQLFFDRALKAKSKDVYVDLSLRLQGIPEFSQGVNVIFIIFSKFS